jgi:predicted regulator of Ras-like GTPase activity (Roadblock/LC7/MglB family)
LELPLQSVLERLPLELRSKMSAKNVDLSRASISIALKKIQPQLSLGIIRITFGELRRAAPSLFNVQDEYDSLPVVLPLSKVLARLSPSVLARNSTQKTVEVPAEITGPFGEHGRGIAISTTPAKSPASSATPPAPMAAPMTTAPPKLRPPPIVPPPPPVMPRQITPAPGIVSAPHSGNGVDNGMIPKPVIPTVPVQPITPHLPAAPVVPVAPIPMPASTPTPVMPAQAGATVPLAALSGKWPEALRSEIAPLISANAQVALPVNLMESALKRGRVTFTWGNLRSWIKPTPPATSVHDTVELELPLKAVVPYFLAKQSGAVKMTRPQQTVPMPVDIPNLFFGFPQPQPPTEMPPTPPRATPPQSPPVEENRPAPKPVETRQPATIAPKPVETRQPATNYYTWVRPEPPHVETPASKFEHERPVTPAIAVDFGDHCITPKEVVSRAAALNGVAGVVVALQDGLMVASQVPPDYSADTLAAFLPQICDRVNQSAKELRMGALDNLNFTVGGVPWKIFRVNAVYFAAFGRAGGQLPDVQLAALAAELDRKKQ